MIPDEISDALPRLADERDDLLDALRRQAIKARKQRNQLRRRKTIGTSGHRKLLRELETTCRDAAILARELGLTFADVEAMGMPGWRP